MTQENVTVEANAAAGIITYLSNQVFRNLFPHKAINTPPPPTPQELPPPSLLVLMMMFKVTLKQNLPGDRLSFMREEGVYMPKKSQGIVGTCLLAPGEYNWG